MVALKRTVCMVVLCSVGAVCAETLSPLVVTGDRVCLRAKADGESEVVLQVSSGTVLQGTGEGSNWVEVVAPAEASVWIASNLVNNGVVQVAKAHVRAGPGLNYPSIGSVQRGDRVDVRSQQYGWVKIGPPASCRLWISGQYVRPARQEKTGAEEAVAKPVVAAVAAARSPEPAVSRATGADDSKPERAVPVEPPQPRIVTPVPVPAPVLQPVVVTVASQAVVKAAAGAGEPKVAAQPAELPEALRKFEKDPGMEQGRHALYRGTMDKCNWLWTKPAGYRLLVNHPRRGILTLCYVSGDPSRLASLEGKMVEVAGKEYRLKGIERPVVVYESVVQEGLHLEPTNLTEAASGVIMPP